MKIFSSLNSIHSIKIKEELRRLAKISSPKKFYLYAIFIGGISGLIALGFSYLLNIAEHYTLHHLAGIDLGSPAGENSSNEGTLLHYSPLILFILPAVGAFISGFLTQKFDPDAAGAGTDAMIYTFHEKKGVAKARTPIVKAFATLAILASGGSAGKEGPLSQIGASIGSIFAKSAGFGPKATRSLYLAGMAGALGAVFLAPLGAALTSVEVLYKEDFESESLVPSILASITGYFVFTGAKGFHQVFALPASSFTDWYELIIYFGLGLACFGAGFIFVKLYHFIWRFFNKIPAPLMLRTTLGGLLVGTIGIICHESLGSGFGFIQKLMQNDGLMSLSSLSQFILSNGYSVYSTIFFLLIVALLKMLTTSLTIGSGGSGGVFGPSLFIGGTIGAAIGMLAEHLFPNITTSYIPFIPVGMAGFFAGVANAPIASVIMVCELTGSYVLLPPLLTVAIISIIFSHRFSIYTTQKKNKFESPAHSWDITNHLLKNFSVEETIPSPADKNIINPETPVKKILNLLSKLNINSLPVVDRNENYLGMVTIQNLTRNSRKELLRSKVLAIDLLEDLPALTMKSSLSYALEIILNHDIEKIALVDEYNRYIGTLDFKEILAGYHKRLTGKEVIVPEKKREAFMRQSAALKD